MSMQEMFVTLIVLQLFFSVGVTMIGHTTPTFFAVSDMSPYTAESGIMDLNKASGIIQNKYTSLQQVPALSSVGLIFNSGILLLDLIGNFFFAIPMMFGIVTKGILLFMNLDAFVSGMIAFFIEVVAAIIWLIALIFFAINLFKQGTTT